MRSISFINRQLALSRYYTIKSLTNSNIQINLLRMYGIRKSNLAKMGLINLISE
jgi:hypothetical protein